MAYEVLMPQLGLTMEEGLVGEWFKKEGDEVKSGEVILAIETDKLSSEVISEHDGVLLKIVAQEGEDVPVKGVLAYIGQPGEVIPEAGQAITPPESVNEAEDDRIRISPYARKMANELDVPYDSLTGSGPMGRIRSADIQAAYAQKPVEEVKQEVASMSAFDAKLMDGDTVIKLTNMRKVVAERMLKSHTEIPSVTQTTKVDVTKLQQFRKMLLQETGNKYSVNDLILAAVSKVLRQHPEMLVSYDGNRIIQRAHVNLGMAVALDGGLVVPVIRDADTLRLEKLAERAKDLASRARENTLKPDEMSGNTFTVTNLGMFGIETFTPIINQPDAAILGVCAIQDELVMDDEGTITKRQMLRLSLTYDHRLLDGAIAAKFVMDLRDLLQLPIRILL